MKNTKNIKFFRDPAINGIEVSRVESSRHVFPKHAHDDIFALSLMTQGASFCLGKEQPDLIASKGEIVLLNPGQVHSGIPIDDRAVSYWMLYADTRAITNLASDIFEQPGILPEFNKMVVKDKGLANKFLSVLTAFEAEKNRFEKDALLSDFFGRLFFDVCSKKPGFENDTGDGGNNINLAKGYLSENLDLGMSLDDVAQKVGISRFHFIRQFKKQTGLSPHQFRIQQRIQAAKKLIKKGLAFSEVALETGFSDQSHFTNKFRRYTGATPSQYARF